MGKKLKKDEKNLLIMVIIAVVLVGIYFSMNLYTNYKNKKQKKSSEQVKYIFSNFQSDGINYISIDNIDKNYKMVLEKNENHWKFIEPKGLRSDDNSVKSYLLNIKYLTYDSKLEASKIKDEKVFGFDKPEMIIKFTGKVGDTIVSYKIIVGAKSPVGNSYYIRRNNEKDIFVIEGIAHDSLIARIDDMRNKKIFSEIPRQELGYIEFINYIDNIHNTFYYFNNKWVWKFSNVEKYYKNGSAAVSTLIERISDFGVNKFINKKIDYKTPDYKIILKSIDGKKVVEFDLIESNENLPPEQKIFTIINKNTHEIYEANLKTIYTYFTEKPYKFFQQQNTKKE